MTTKRNNFFDKFRYRRLHDWEIAESRLVFGDKLHYERVKIYEDFNVADMLDNIGRRIKGMPPRESKVHNAITFGYRVLFGAKLPTELQKGGWGMTWLMHELTHVCQYQSLGWKYLFQAWDAQRKLGSKVYDFGGEEGLKSSRKSGKFYKAFNLEQQAHIVETYYKRLRKGEDTSAWKPYVDEFLRG
jgi:hypothetical protein